MKRTVTLCLRPLILLACLTACEATSSTAPRAQYEGTPQDWWSDNYMTLVQDLNADATVAQPTPRASRIRLF